MAKQKFTQEIFHFVTTSPFGALLLYKMGGEEGKILSETKRVWLLQSDVEGDGIFQPRTSDTANGGRAGQDGTSTQESKFVMETFCTIKQKNSSKVQIMQEIVSQLLARIPLMRSGSKHRWFSLLFCDVSRF